MFDENLSYEDWDFFIRITKEEKLFFDHHPRLSAQRAVIEPRHHEVPDGGVRHAQQDEFGLGRKLVFHRGPVHPFREDSVGGAGFHGAIGILRCCRCRSGGSSG